MASSDESRELAKKNHHKLIDMASSDESRELAKKKPQKLMDRSPDNDTKQEKKKKKKYTKISKEKSKTQPSESSDLKHKSNPPTSPRHRNVKRKQADGDSAAKTVSISSDGRYEKLVDTQKEAEDGRCEKLVDTQKEAEVEERESKRWKVNSGEPNKRSASDLKRCEELSTRLEAARERLRKGYQEAENKRRNRSVQFLDPKDIPNQRIDNPGGNRFFYGKKKKNSNK